MAMEADDFGVFELRNPDELHKHPRNTQIYGDKVDQDFVASVGDEMFEKPVIGFLEGKPTIVSGHRRVQAARIIGLKEIACEVRYNLTDPDRILELLLKANEQREKSEEQKARERLVKLELYKKEAKARKVENFKKNGETAAPYLGESVKRLAAEEGIDWKTAYASVNAVKAADEAKAEGRTGQARKIIEMLNKRGPHPAQQLAKQIQAGRKPKAVEGGDEPEVPVDVKLILELAPLYTAVLTTLIPKAQDNALEIKTHIPSFPAGKVSALCKELHKIFSDVPIICPHCQGTKCSRCGKGWVVKQ